MFVGYVPDLMDRSRLTGVRFVRSLDEVHDGDGPVLLDLNRAGAVEAVPALVAAGRRVVGFSSHVDRATVDAARDAGAEVHARSELFRRWAEIAGP
jgi:hypothetical protein